MGSLGISGIVFLVPKSQYELFVYMGFPPLSGNVNEISYKRRKYIRGYNPTLDGFSKFNLKFTVASEEEVTAI